MKEGLIVDKAATTGQKPQQSHETGRRNKGITTQEERETDSTFQKQRVKWQCFACISIYNGLGASSTKDAEWQPATENRAHSLLPTGERAGPGATALEGEVGLSLC